MTTNPRQPLITTLVARAFGVHIPASTIGGAIFYFLLPTFAFPLAALLVLSSVLCPLSSASAQGSLTPSTGPTPTMKTLDQIDTHIGQVGDQRTPISASNVIYASGSYYLTGNLSIGSGGGTAITIAASGVTLDLNGFTISSSANPNSGTGILINSGLTDITIINGHIAGNVIYDGSTFSGSGFVAGISYTGSVAQQCPRRGSLGHWMSNLWHFSRLYRHRRRIVHRREHRKLRNLCDQHLPFGRLSMRQQCHLRQDGIRLLGLWRSSGQRVGCPHRQQLLRHEQHQHRVVRHDR